MTSGAKFWLLAVILFLSESMEAIILMDGADPERNTTAPTGELVGSGWDLQGKWGNFLGTPVGSQYFVTATHTGGTNGQTFELGGISYTTTAHFDDPQSDLTVWKIAENFPSFAPLYSESNELSKPVMVFGRGTIRGDDIVIETLRGPELKGWRWGALDGKMRWGQNEVDGFVTGSGTVTNSGSQGGPGLLLKLAFNERGGTHEAHLSPGDSGGGLFIQSGGIWKLAAINFGVDGPYNTNAVGAGFNASIFDERGLYIGVENDWSVVPLLPRPQPGCFYSTRIWTRFHWIQSITLADAIPQLLVATNIITQFQLEPEAIIDTTNRVIRTAASDSQRFYRLVSERQMRIREIKEENGSVVLSYE